MTVLTWNELSEATNLGSSADEDDLLERIRTRAGSLTYLDLRPYFLGNDPSEQATALLVCAAMNFVPQAADVEAALRQESATVCAAAAICAVKFFGGQLDFLQRMLLGSTEWIPSYASVDGRHFLILAMGRSGDARFVALLRTALSHPHFCRSETVAQALASLGETVKKLTREFSRSISVTTGHDRRLIIEEDENYGGGSNCPQCRFFPCRINFLHRGGIEECQLWNRANPADFGEFFEQRNWGHSSEIQENERNSQELQLIIGRNFLKKGEATTAIPPLCGVLVLDEGNSVLGAVIWANLSRCFAACGEPLLEFVALREASRLRNLVGLNDDEERAVVDRFVDDPEAFLGQRLSPDLQFRFALRGQGYRRAGLATQALDCYAQALICQGGSSGGSWFEMGECFSALGELCLAELFYWKAASLDRGLSLREKFLGQAEAARNQRGKNDPGLSIERRRLDRSQNDPCDLPVVEEN